MYRSLFGGLRLVTGMRQQVVVINGLELPYLRGGKGPPLVLIHGFGDRKETWLPLAIHLFRGHELVALDLAGFGHAPQIEVAQASISAQSVLVLAFLDALGLDRVHLCGSSLGGGIAARLGHDHPDRVASLVLLGPVGPKGPSGLLLEMVKRGENLLIPANYEEYEAFLSFAMERPPYLPRPLRRYMATQWMSRRIEHEVYFDRLLHPLPGERVPEEVRPIKIPTILIYGKQERLVDLDDREEFVAGIPQIEVVMLDGVGHAPHIERTALVARMMRRFLAAASSQ
jgi:pimeloyl-ACP methyl ester carboxylesterase